MTGARGEESEHFYRQPESAASSSYASPAHCQHPAAAAAAREPQPIQLPHFKVLKIIQPPSSYDSSFHCIHTSIEVVVVGSLICATSELVLGIWVLYVLSRTSSHTSSKYITIAVGLIIAQIVRVYALLTWLKSSKQELTKAYSSTTLCVIVSIFILLPLSCLALVVTVVVFDFSGQIEVLGAFILVIVFDMLFSVFFGSIIACRFQSRLQKRQNYLRTCQINIRPPPPQPTRTATTTPSTTSSRRIRPHQQQQQQLQQQHLQQQQLQQQQLQQQQLQHYPPSYEYYDDHNHYEHSHHHHHRPAEEFNFHPQFHYHSSLHSRNNSLAYV